MYESPMWGKGHPIYHFYHVISTPGGLSCGGEAQIGLRRQVNCILDVRSYALSFCWLVPGAIVGVAQSSPGRRCAMISIGRALLGSDDFTRSESSRL